MLAYVLADKTHGKEPIYPYFWHFCVTFFFYFGAKGAIIQDVAAARRLQHSR